jgi:hypothetical protein
MGKMRQFQLLEDLRPGGSARAILLRWDGAKYVPSDEEIELFEYVGLHGDRGDRGYCCFSDESNHWEAASGLYEQVASWLPG